MRRTEADDAGALAERLGKRRAERDGHVLDRVMGIDMKIARRRDLEIDQRVPRDLLEHVIEKADPGLDPGRTRPVEIERDADRRFLRRPFL